MRKLLTICACAVALAATAPARAGEVTWQLTSNLTNAGERVQGTAPRVVGEIEAVHVHIPAGVTVGSIMLEVVYPYANGPRLVIGTNDALTSYHAFSPRVVISDAAGGSTAGYVVTNDGGGLILMAGETLTASMALVSTTNAPVLLRCVTR